MNPANEHSVMALLLGALSISVLHALIPSHWLAFALVGRAQQWTVRRTLLVTALAGTGHVLLTVLLGMVLAVMGKGLLRAISPAAEHAATTGLLIALGLYFAGTGIRCGGSCHHHGHAHGEEGVCAPATQRLRGPLGEGPTVMGALVLGMTLSPCLDLLSIYVAAATAAVPSSVLVAISATMAVTTIGLMLLLVWLTLHGLKHVKLDWLERNEGVALGGILVALGILLFFL